MKRTEFCKCVYHSGHWAMLVETGWVTSFVKHGTAYMIRKTEEKIAAKMEAGHE